MEAYTYTPGGDGRGKVSAEIPAALAADAKARHEALVELVAEGKDELMEEFFDKGTLAPEHLIAALHEAIREDRIFPVLFSSGLANMALDHLLDFLKAYAPSAVERAPIAAKPADGAAADAPVVTRKVADTEPAAAVVFKTMSDPFAGRISFFKVISGVIKNDATLENYTRRGQEKLSHLSVMQGRKAVEVPELHAGDMGAVAKLRDTLTGDTLGSKAPTSRSSLAAMPEPAMTYAIEPKSRADEDKLAPAIHKLMEEDLLIRFFRDPQTNEFLIAGAGQPHIEAIVSRLKKRYHAEVTLKAPKVPYRETIRAKAEAHGPPQEADRRPRPVRRLQDSHGALAPRRAASSSPAKSSAAPSRATSSPPSKKASSSPPPAAISPATRSSISRPSSTTAAITTSTPTNSPSRWPAASPSATAWRMQALPA